MIQKIASEVKTLKSQYILNKRKNHQMFHFILQRRFTSSTKILAQKINKENFPLNTNIMQQAQEN
jgi:hypothetical protein